MTTQDYTKEIGQVLFTHMRAKDHPLALQWWTQKMLELSMLDPKLKDQLFRYVDILPILKTDKDVSKALEDYVNEANPALASILRYTNKIPGIKHLISPIVKTGVELIARTFIFASNLDEAITETKKIRAKGLTYSLDILGEMAISEAEAETYLKKYLYLIENIPKTNVSIKLSSIYSKISAQAFELTKRVLKDRLRVIYRTAIKHGAEINVDLEHYEWKDLTNTVVQELLMEDEFRDWGGAGIVVQAYLKSSKTDLEKWLSFLKRRGTKMMIRLVKGAYWDYETALAQQRNWESPVYTIKAQSDQNFEELTEILFKNHEIVKPAIASHNLRSLANALNQAKKYKLRFSEYELQMLYGMMDSLKDFLSKDGIPVRVYLPYGELIPGMAYLVRRLLENTANESFLKQGLFDQASQDELLKKPEVKEENDAFKVSKHPIYPGYQSEPDSDFSIKEKREAMLEALADMEKQLDADKKYPLVINGEKIYSNDTQKSVNPAKPSQGLGFITQASLDDAKNAMHAAKSAFKTWSKTDEQKRIRVFRNIAKEIRDKRFYFNALLCYEAAKPWQEADGEVSEIIDFLEYYSAQAHKMYFDNPLMCFSGEKNKSSYKPHGVCAAISPWNFPLAIMGGMTAAALITGNTVIIKPSGQTCIIAYEFFKIVHRHIKENFDDYEGVINFLPGKGSTIGNYLVEHEDLAMVSFTGSSKVGFEMNAKLNANKEYLETGKESLARVKHLSAETGGKNALIVDNNADLDEAVPGVLFSAFAFAGQKCSACSRVIVLEDVYDHFLARLQTKTKGLFITDPQAPYCEVSPMIDENSLKNAQEYVEIGKQEGKVLVADLKLPKEGYYLSPTIFYDLPKRSRLIHEEIFAPVLVVQKAKDLDEAIELANDTPYGLTGGIYSRNPGNIEKASREVEVGNFYINRRSTGAIVGRQAFGGMKLSSIGFKAGGPNYLLNFVKEKTITENTMRRGFAIDE